MFDHFIAYKACCIVFIHYLTKSQPGSILSKFYQVWVQSNVITKVDSDQIWQSNMKFELIRPSLDVRKEMHLLKLSEKNVIRLI